MIIPTAINTFSNRTSPMSGRSFPGLASPHATEGWTQSPQTARLYHASAGDIFRLSGISDKHPPFMLVVGKNGRPAPDLLGLKGDTSPPDDGFDPRDIEGWITTRGIRTDGQWVQLAGDEDELILKATAQCDLWIVIPVPESVFLEGTDIGTIEIRRQPANPNLLRLPDPLGRVHDEFTITRGTAHAYELAEGDFVQIIDVEGQQCSDFMAFDARDLNAGRESIIDNTATRTMVRRASPGPGLFDKFYGSNMQPMLQVLQDTCGRHDMLGLACTARGYEERGFPGHINCSDNISHATAPFGVQRRNAWPAINFFWNTWMNEGTGHIETEESWSRPGDFVTMKALQPLVCVSTACPDDIDPINGWNPTDIHVRIYRSDTPVRRAVAYREKEDSTVSISQESPFHAATSKLTRDFSHARNLWLPNSYNGVGTVEEYWACREAVSLQDMSSLRKYDIIGPDAERLLQLATTRDVSKLAVWRGQYTLMCDAQGAVIDDGTLFRMAPQLFRWFCGTEECARHLTGLVGEHSLNVRINAMGDAMPNLALQGPKSRDLLRDLVFTQPHVPALDDLKWFGATVARIKDRTGVPFMLCRSGYTGELGYELFCGAKDAPQLWDSLMEAGEPYGIKPMGGAALDILRIEAGLAAGGAEFAAGVDAFEAGLGFAVNLKKSDFVGKAALERNASAQRMVLKGLILDQDEVPRHGAHVYDGERPVGVITSATRSPMLECGIAMARLAIEQAEDGNILQIGQMDGHMKRLTARVAPVPFVDPKRERARA